MKKCWLILLALTVVTAMFAYEVVAWQEDFEGDIDGWSHYDGAESPNMWHIYNYGGTQGDCWWMGDPDLAQGANIGGYHSHQYLVLDTPARTLSADNATLTFKMRHKVEDPGVHENYDVWDSMNIRISTNNGATWTVITGTPAYHGTSSYAFGQEHGEGQGIPAWGGSLLNWTTATFNLSSYVGQSVKIRFAFASDPAYDTTNDRSMFGWMVDDISFGGYTNNGVDDGQMVASSMVPLGGDLWHLSTDPAAPSPTHVMKCQNNQGTYNPNMLNYLVSPSIQLPNSGDIRVDFMIQGGFTDSGTFPNVDYFGWEISPDDGETWYAMSNPYGSSTGTNYVYSDAPDVWASMVGSYSLDGYISDYAGESVRFRWYFKSNETVSGIGIMVDDVKIYNDVYIEAPSNLTVTVDEANVTLNWQLGGGGGGGEEGWLSYCGENAGNSIGIGNAADFDVAAKWDASGEFGINPYVGMQITKIQFVPASAYSECQYSVRLWTGGAGNLVYEQAIPSHTQNQWNEIVLTTPWTIPSGTAVWAGYRNNTTGGYPAGCDEGPAVVGYGNMIRLNNAWSPLTDLNDALDYNWNIKVYVQDANGREYQITTPTNNIQSPISDLAVNRIELPNRDANSFKIFRDTILIDEIPGDQMTYTDMNVSGGLHTYYVTAMYGNNESNSSNVAIAFVLPEMHAELFNDDGSAEEGFSVGSTKMMAVKHVNDGRVSIKYAKIFVHTANPSGIIIRVFDNDGPNGTPGTQVVQYQYPASSVMQGWNYMALPSNIVDSDGTFYLAIMETPNASLIGVDTSSNGYSYTKTGSSWDPFTTGELMIRAIVETFVDNDDPSVPSFTTKLEGNYPNPFNPETTISFTLRESQPVNISIYNIKGQLVRKLINETKAAGNHKVVWTGLDNNNRAVSSGVYYYKMTAGSYSSSKKMILMK